MEVNVDRVMNASPKTLYAMWTDPELISEWFGVKVDIKPKIGGYLRFALGKGNGKDLPHGVYKILDPYNRVAFTWNAYNGELPTGETLVTVTFTPEGTNNTRMTLVHSGFSTEVARAEHDKGWNYFYGKWESKLNQ